MIYKSYKYRLYPTNDQKVLLEKHFGATRFVFNWALESKIKFYKETGKGISKFSLNKELTSFKKQEEYNWLYEVNAQSLQESITNLDSAYTNFFRKQSKFPKFKSKNNNHQSFSCPQNNKVNFDKSLLFIPKFKEGIKIKIDRTFIGKIKTVTISRTPTNKYFASILVETPENLPVKPELNIEKAVGLDLGLKSFITLSDGQKFDNPKFIKKSTKKLIRQFRKFSHKKRGSNNKSKQRIKLARLYEKITNQRNDFLQKLSTKLIKESQFETFCIENLNISGMVKNHSLAKAISDSGWATFIKFLTYKSNWYGKNIIQIGRFEPSSKVCNECGTINQKLTLSDRTWTCPCGAILDRDINAAKNIKDFAFFPQNLLPKIG